MGPKKNCDSSNSKSPFLVREMYKDLIKPIHADKIIKEKVEIKELSLYFKSLYAF